MRGKNWDEPTAMRGDGAVPTKVEQTYTLTTLDGPDAGLTCRIGGLESSRILAGKSPACVLRLTDGQVSRRHAAFETTDAGLRVTDLDSTNGTTVNGVRVVDAYVSVGDRVRLGETSLRVDRGDAQAVARSGDARFGRMRGASDAMRRLYPLCRRLAASDLPILIEGETGTGKEVLAEALHEASARATEPFVVFDCTAVPPTLAESTLFGHEKGAFTGAVATRKGVFEEASGGTLFIDELGELEPSLQPKLLRALERGEVQRVGTNRWIRVDVRIIAATRRDLDREIQAGRFRDDLFFRLAGARIELPPLRRRAGDVELLARHFWSEAGGAGELSPQVLARFADYPWPGNVRELHHAIARVHALGTSAALEMSTSSRVPGATGATTPAEGDLVEEVLAADLPLTRARDLLVSGFERRYLERVLAAHGGSVARAADASGVARRYFQILHARYRGT
jgi:transcriptional regulator with GAF, ATPase, and Fis domain